VGTQTAAAVGSGSGPVVAGEDLHSVVVLVGVTLGLPVLEAPGHLAEVAAGSRKSNSVAAAELLSVDSSAPAAPKSTTLPSEAVPLDSRTHTVEEAD